MTQLRPDGGPLIGNYNSDVNGYTGAGTWVWQCTKYRSAFYSFGLETLSLADRTEIVSRTLQAFVAPRPTLGIELTAQDAYFTGAAIGQPGSVATHVMRLRNSGDGGITQTITLDASGNVWPSKLSGTSFTLAPCATATVTMTTSIPDTLGWNASDAITVTSAIASSPVTRASVSFTTKTPAGVLLVDHDRFYNVEGSYASALAAQGNIADRWDTNWGVVITSTPSAAFLQQYPIVIWFNGYDWFDPLNKRDEKALRTYLDRGGRLFVASQSALQYQADSSLAANYLGVSKVEYEDGISITTRLDGTSLGDGIANGSLLPFPYNWNLSTAVQPMSGTQIFLLNNTGHPAGVLRDGAPGSRWRTALTPFAFEALSQPTRDDLMNGIVGWLSPLGQSSLNIDKHSAQPGDTVLFTIALRADDVISPTYVADHPASMSLTLPGGLTLISSTLTNGAWAGVVHNGDWLTWTASARVNEGLAAGTPLTASARFSLDDVGIGFTRQAVVRVGAPDLAASLSVNSPEPTWGGVVTLTLRLTNAAPVPSANTLVTVTLPHGMVVAAADSAGTRGDSESQTAAGQFVWRGAVGANETIAVTFAARLPKLTSSAAPVAFISAQVAGASGTTGSARLWLAPKTYWLRYPFMAR